MSKENVEIVRDVVGALFDRREFGTAARHLDPRAEWHNAGAIDQRWAITFRLADGLVVRADARGDYGKALAAAGLATE